jgi:curved DNA-binding protein CbpA
MREHRNPYLILGVDEHSTPGEIKFAFKVKAQRNHPDREGGSDAAMSDIQWAYSILRDKEKREHWDLNLSEKMAEPSFSDKATTHIMGAFNQWLQGVFSGQIPINADCVTDLYQAIDRELGNARQGKKQIEGNISKVDKMLGRFDCDNDQHNFFEGHLQSTKDAAHRKLLEIEDQIKIMEESLEQLKHFTYSPDGGLVLMQYPSTSTTTGFR